MNYINSINKLVEINHPISQRLTEKLKLFTFLLEAHGNQNNRIILSIYELYPELLIYFAE